MNNGTLTMNVSGTGLSGSQTFTANQSSAATFTVTSNATTTAGAANTIVARDGNGYIFNNYFNSTDNSVASGVTAVMVKQGDSYLRSGTAASIATFISGQSMNISGSSTSCSGNAATATLATAVAYLPNRTDGTAYPILWGAAYTSGSGTIAYSASSCTITSSNGLITGGILRTNSNIYWDQNYGYGAVGLYNAAVFQGYFAMGDAYKLTAAGAINNLYGVTWSHPNAGGIAANLDSHGLIVAINGGFGSCLSYNVKASANVTAYSDERLKRNWEPLCDNFVEKLAGVKVGTYERIDLPIVQVGVSAQSLEKVLPEAVSTATDDLQTKSVAYGNAALASAVMLAQEVVELKKMMKQMQAELAELKRGM